MNVAMTVYVVNTRTQESWLFNSMDDAVDFIDSRMDVDYEGVISGEYLIDDMNVTD